jgi:hypothetical protein
MDRSSGPADSYGGPQDRFARGSLADLRLRLERLPAGHPSSPYEDTGAPRPAPQQLRQLELPLADEERESDPSARASLLAATAGDRNGSARPPLASPGPGAEDATSPAPGWKLSHNGPGLPVAAPPGTGSARPQLPTPNGKSDNGDWNDPDGGAAGQNGHSGRYATFGDLAAAPSARAVPPAADAGGYDTGSFDAGSLDTGSFESPSLDTGSLDTGSLDTGSLETPSLETPSLDTGSLDTGSLDTGSLDTGSYQATGLRPAERGAPDQAAASNGAATHGAATHGAGSREAADKPAPDRGPAAPPAGQAPAAPAAARRGGLTPEQEQIANRALGRYRAADGRNVFGGYGESGLTPAIRRVESHLPHGRLAGDSEDYTLKSPERFKEKLARMIARNPGVPAEELVAEIYDAARYTFVFEPQEYTDGTWLVHRRLKAQGFELEARRNRWETPEYKGIRTRWRDPAHDLAFEVQFHTPSSWDVLQRTHEAYLRITDPQTPPAERAQLRSSQVAAAAASRPPPRCAEIGDFRADTR